jgi:hypothetical protein
VPREQLWRKKVSELAAPSYLAEVSRMDAENKSNIDISTLKEPAYTTVKSKAMLAILVLFVLACLGLWVLAFLNSTLPRITGGVDFRANACGIDWHKGRPFLYYPVILESTELAICVSSCPSAIVLVH